MGQYVDEMQKVCNICPEGFFCPNPAAEVIKKCPEGQYSDAGWSKCLMCPGGFTCAGGKASTKTAVTVKTSYSTYSEEGSNVERRCPAGYNCDLHGMTIHKCNDGYYSKGNQCVICPAGKFCLQGIELEVNCPTGFYSLAGESKCKFANAGHFVSFNKNTPVNIETTYASTLFLSAK